MASETTIKVVLFEGNTLGRQRSPGHSAAPRTWFAARLRAGLMRTRPLERSFMQTVRARGVCESALKFRHVREGMLLENGVQSRGQNRTREIRPSWIVGGLAKTWVWSKLNGHIQRKRRNGQAWTCSRARRKSIPTSARSDLWEPSGSHSRATWQSYGALSSLRRSVDEEPQIRQAAAELAVRGAAVPPWPDLHPTSAEVFPQFTQQRT